MLEATLIKVVAAAVGVETALAALIIWLRRRCAWLITGRDRLPVIDREGLNAFLEHGWDAEIGWVRKPNTRHGELGRSGVRTSYSLDGFGARRNPGFENRPVRVLAYGDSYTFARQVNNEEAWPHVLSTLLDANVANFGVGNYGLDQALLRLEREFDDHPAPVVMMGLVPETLCRILSVWKHFSEYGNTFGFKPRFVLENGALRLLPNPVDDPAKFFRIAEFYDHVAANDYFHDSKFSRDILTFPFVWSLARSWRRNLPMITAALSDRLGLSEDAAFVRVMRRNIDLTSRLFRDPEAVALFKAVTRRFISFCRDRGAEPVLVMMPQLMDNERIEVGDHYYQPVLDDLAAEMTVIDLAPALLARSNVGSLFIHDRYGGHMSVDGNRIIADVLAPVCRTLLAKARPQTAFRAHYPYASGDLLEDRYTYFYSHYAGRPFLDAWRAERDAVLAALPEPAPPPPGSPHPDIGRAVPVDTDRLLDHVFHALTGGDADDEVADWLDRLVKKFEVTKRIHRAYGPGFRAIDPDDHRLMGRYVRLAEVFDAAWTGRGELTYLNALLKCMDTLAALHDRLDAAERARLARLLARERAHVEALADRTGAVL